MADNYLEKKMEDLRNRKRTSDTRSPSPYRMKGVLVFPFSHKKVLIDIPDSITRLILIREFVRTGSQVAVIEKDEQIGNQLAHDEGVRVYHSDDTHKVLANLCHEWGWLTQIVCTPDRENDLAKEWRSMIEGFDNTSYSGRRFITLKEKEDAIYPDLLAEIGVACNNIVAPRESLDKFETAERFTNICTFLAVVGNENIRNITFHV
ncbi:MAG: hypothetical protein K2N05_07885 [Muribaculaceae bacterium]|nr:hypothetical protein [Muribaculaceae bacterium]